MLFFRATRRERENGHSFSKKSKNQKIKKSKNQKIKKSKNQKIKKSKNQKIKKSKNQKIKKSKKSKNHPSFPILEYALRMTFKTRRTVIC